DQASAPPRAHVARVEADAPRPERVGQHPPRARGQHPGQERGQPSAFVFLPAQPRHPSPLSPAWALFCRAALCSRQATRSARRGPTPESPGAKGDSMLWTFFVILLILWLLGMVSSYTMGGFIHLLLILAIVVVLIRVIQGRSPI